MEKPVSLKILIVNTQDIQGGAARAAHRLFKGLKAFGMDCQMLVQTKSSQDYSIIGPESKLEKLKARINPILDQFCLRKYKNKSQTLFSCGFSVGGNLVERINKLAPDIVHLHWVNEGFLRIEDISKIKAPIVWSLHDMWPFTGGCHYDEECGAFVKACGSCKVLKSTQPHDISSKIFQIKKKTYARAHITVVGLSQWLTTEAKKSPLFEEKSIVNLPNLIDPIDFNTIDKNFARKLFGLPLNKKLLLFGAMEATSDPRKGFQQLTEALAELNSDYELVVFGSEAPRTPPQFKQKSHFLGHLNDKISLKALYNAADVMIVPSLQENLSNAIMESLACGTPVVAFDVGGNGDMIIHQQNGYLAKPFDTSDLAKGITQQIEVSEQKRLQISTDTYARFGVDKVIPRYIELYQTLKNSTFSG